MDKLQPNNVTKVTVIATTDEGTEFRWEIPNARDFVFDAKPYPPIDFYNDKIHMFKKCNLLFGCVAWPNKNHIMYTIHTPKKPKPTKKAKSRKHD